MDKGKGITWLSRATGLDTFPVVAEQWRNRKQNLIPHFESQLRNIKMEIASFRKDAIKIKDILDSDSKKEKDRLKGMIEVAERDAADYRFAIRELHEFFQSIHSGFEANILGLKSQLKRLDAGNYQVPKYRLTPIPEELKSLHAVGFLAFRYKTMLEEREKGWNEDGAMRIVRDSLKPPLDIAINEALRLLEKYGYDDDDIDAWRPKEDSDDVSSVIEFGGNPARSEAASADDSLASISRLSRE